MDKTGIFQFHFPFVLTESWEWYKRGPVFNLIESLAPSCLPLGLGTGGAGVDWSVLLGLGC